MLGPLPSREVRRARHSVAQLLSEVELELAAVDGELINILGAEPLDDYLERFARSFQDISRIEAKLLDAAQGLGVPVKLERLASAHRDTSKTLTEAASNLSHSRMSCAVHPSTSQWLGAPVRHCGAVN